jgi:hypothetical protein
VEIEFHRASQVRVTWARRGQRARFFRSGDILHRQRLLPIRPILVIEAQSNRRADRLPMSNAGQSFDSVLFDFLAPASPIAELPAMQFPMDEFEVNRHTRG